MTSTSSTSAAPAKLLSAAPTLAEAMTRPYDNFTLLRLILALAVVVSHGFSVSNAGTEPLQIGSDFTLGEHAVNGFFAISGFLVTMSFARRGWRDYVVARALRIAPAFIVVTLVMALCGAALTTLSAADYWSDPAVPRFVIRTLTTFKSAGVLPGVFADNPMRFPLGTVWTLKYEVLCYLGVLAFGLLIGLERRAVALAIVAGLAVAVVFLDALVPDAGKAVQTSLRLPLIFGSGAVLYLYRDRVRISPLILVLVLALTWLAHGSVFYKAALFMTEAYGIVFLAVAPGLSAPILNIKTDLSYGTYLCGWPVQQALQQYFPGVSIPVILPVAILLTLVVAALSWFLVEKPALRLKAHLLGEKFKAPGSVGI
jgi:peptidoglycan/LPS O-acetylase OafA/YrhL